MTRLTNPFMIRDIGRKRQPHRGKLLRWGEGDSGRDGALVRAASWRSGHRLVHLVTCASDERQRYTS